MKTPPSSPFDLNSDAAAGCLSGIVRRLPCACSLRNNAPGDSSESEGSGGSLGLEWKNSAMQKKPPATPSIVARLMGLDSMPVFPYTPPESAKRNRSSSSLIEAPTYLRQENEKFLILTFAPKDEAESVVVSGRKGKVKVGDLKERTKEIGSTERRVAERKTRNKHKNSPKKNSTGRKHSNGRITKLDSNVKPMKLEEMPITSEGANSTKKKLSAAQRKTKAGYSTQETSPVSVLDYTSVDGEYCISLNSPDSEEELLPPPPQSSRKKLSSKFESFNSTPSNFHLQTISRGREVIFLDEPCKKSSNAEPVIPDRSRVWKKICILTEEDMKKNSTWMSREGLRSEEGCEIAAVVALKVLDLLLEEAVSEIFSST